MPNETKTLMQRITTIEQTVDYLEKQMNAVTAILERIVPQINCGNDKEHNKRQTDFLDTTSEKNDNTDGKI
tara:strand:+ start:582 stop:794 length:213 start_codon:yes stop_codon:yes gene_type:complete